MDTTLLIVPGLGDSGEKHWQTYWLKKFENAIKAEQENWDEPNLDEWVTRLNDSIIKAQGKIILVAHSLAVSLVIHWAKRHTNDSVTKALLVAPADVDSPAHTPDIVRGFAPMPTSRLPFNTIVVASSNDSFVSVSRAKFFADNWGDTFINIGPKGHINGESDLGFWEEGQGFLKTILQATNS